MFLHEHTEIARRQHAIDRQRQLFAGTLGYELTPESDAGLVRAGTVEGRALLLHGTTWATKHWPVEMWIDLAKRIEADGATAASDVG